MTAVAVAAQPVRHLLPTTPVRAHPPGGVENRPRRPHPRRLQIATEDAGALWKRATDAGTEVFRPLADVFRGERHGQVIDPFGHR
ncbi:VOC family protein [Saccharothrix sp. NRRL B-16348]|uniref:VOC family protein n=1 Tax=Saccharothrix sp. NRRL B-16348 TaxID=1415542 RepID=UPI002F3F3648